MDSKIVIDVQDLVLTPMLVGVRIVTNNMCFTEKIEQRTWKERLLTIPWRPLIKEKTVCYPAAYLIQEPECMSVYFPRMTAPPGLQNNYARHSGTTMLVCHPSLEKEIKDLMGLSLADINLARLEKLYGSPLGEKVNRG